MSLSVLLVEEKKTNTFESEQNVFKESENIVMLFNAFQRPDTVGVFINPPSALHSDVTLTAKWTQTQLSPAGLTERHFIWMGWLVNE